MANGDRNKKRKVDQWGGIPISNTKDPALYSDRIAPYFTETGLYMDPRQKSKYERSEKVGNWLKDLGSAGLALTQFRQPTGQETKAGREGWGEGRGAMVTEPRRMDLSQSSPIS